MYSIGDKEPFENIESHLQHLTNVKGSFPPHDRVHQREVTREAGLAKAHHLGCEFLEISAKIGFNVDRTFSEITRLCRYRKEVESHNIQVESNAIRNITLGLKRFRRDTKCIVM
ncbi:hypothetical protein CPB86DRAFT_780494 [Serendipita vermifera]|nr:hypothetical protein CPB86DRAFT_780494 [Serendipita vermifera]